MKTKILIVAVAVVVIGSLIFGYTRLSRERVADETADQPIIAAARIQTGANGETVISLDIKTQQLIGLQTAPLVAMTLRPEVKAYGRVLDSAALISLHNDMVAAKAALQASQPEFERLKKLSAQDNASAHALEAAEAQMEHDQGALDTAGAQLGAAACTALLDEPSDFFQSLAREQRVLVRLDLPAGETPPDLPAAAKVVLPQTQTVAADFLGRAAATDPQVQGAGFIFAVTNPPPTLTPGLSVAGFLQLPAEPVNGVLVPETAVVRSGGHASIYVQITDNTFARREISVDRPLADGWLVTNGVAPGENVVVTGAQTLFSEEHKSEIRIGD